MPSHVQRLVNHEGSVIIRGGWDSTGDRGKNGKDHPRELIAHILQWPPKGPRRRRRTLQIRTGTFNCSFKRPQCSVPVKNSFPKMIYSLILWALCQDLQQRSGWTERCSPAPSDTESREKKRMSFSI